jgi:hypothetical protein
MPWYRLWFAKTSSAFKILILRATLDRLVSHEGAMFSSRRQGGLRVTGIYVRYLRKPNAASRAIPGRVVFHQNWSGGSGSLLEDVMDLYGQRAPLLLRQVIYPPV